MARAAEQVQQKELIEAAAFRVGPEEYLIDLHRVREIIRPVPITPVRKAPKFVEGVIDLRGAIIPIIDLRKRFDLDAAPPTKDTRFIIAVVNGRIVGLIVDAATDILRVPHSSVRPAPQLLSEDQAPFFLGICNFKGRLMTLLNIKRVVASDEPIVLDEYLSEQAELAEMEDEEEPLETDEEQVDADE